MFLLLCVIKEVKMISKFILWFEKHNKISWAITILVAVFIFYMSSKTFPSGTPTTSFLSILYHFLVFAVFAFFLSLAIIRGSSKNFNYLLTLIILISTAYAISDEIHQFFVPGRTSCLKDILINSAGILFSGFFYSVSVKFRNNH